VSARLVERCELCGSENLREVLSLGSSPPTCVMVPVGRAPATEEHHPLTLLECADCSLVQLSVIVAPEIVFADDYPYSSGNSAALHEHFAELALAASFKLGPDDLVVDIGANDGTLLSKFTGVGCRTLGVEPTAQADKILGPVCRGFFSEALARSVVGVHGHAKVVTACNVLAHVADIADVMAGIRLLLADDGVLVAENHDLASITGGPWGNDLAGQWDTIYHEHLRFYSPRSFYALLGCTGLGAHGWQHIPTHGGSFRMLARKGTHQIEPPPKLNYDFARLAKRAAGARAGIRAATAAGGVWGIGATARATTIVNYCGLDVGDIACVCEVSGSDKIGHYIPGTRIPVIDERELFGSQRPNRAMLFSWHLAGQIVPKLRKRGYDGEIIVPLPAVRSIRQEHAA
jgi:hypothetical protein